MPVWALGSFLLGIWNGADVIARIRAALVSVPVWALGSFLPSRVIMNKPSRTRACLWFQCPCGLWGLFYPPEVLGPGRIKWRGLVCFSARVGSGVFSTLASVGGRTVFAVYCFSARVGSGVFSTVLG